MITLTRRFTRFALIASATCIATVLAAPASSGAPGLRHRFVHQDAAGDQASDGAGTPTDTGDVLATAVRYGRYAVHVRTRFNDLDASDGLTIGVDFFTDAHRPSETPDFWRSVNVSGTSVALYQAGPVAHFACDGLRFDTDYDTNKFLLRVPRSCLDRPRWVRAEVSDVVTVLGPGDMDVTHWTDDGLASNSTGGVTPRLYVFQG